MKKKSFVARLQQEWEQLGPAGLLVLCISVFALVILLGVYNSGKESVYRANREMLASASTATCPGIADASGNCMAQATFQFTILETQTPAQVCTPVPCLTGDLVCPDNVVCVNGCGYVCMVDEPTQGPPREPDWVCLYYYMAGRKPIQRCYPALRDYVP